MHVNREELSNNDVLAIEGIGTIQNNSHKISVAHFSLLLFNRDILLPFVV